MNNTITIHKPKITMRGKDAILSADIEFDNAVRTAWFKVSAEYGIYLDSEVVDAFVIGMLSRAIRYGYDIVCKAPVSEELFFNLTVYTIPTIYKYSQGRAHLIDIIAQPLTRKTNANGVGTGVSGGIDSSDAIVEVLKAGKRFPNMNLTHLAYFVHDRNEIVPGEQLEEFRILQMQEEQKKVYKISKQLKLPIIEIESNIYNVDGVIEEVSHSFHGPANVFALAKLFKTYFSAGAYDLEDFSMVRSYDDQAYSDAFIFPMLSTSNLRFYMAGITRNRFEKTENVAGQSWLFDNMNVCFPHKGTKCGPNCIAGKCMCTMWDLEILGMLDKYKKSLPVEEFRKQKSDSLHWLYKKYMQQDRFAKETVKRALANQTISATELRQMCLKYRCRKYLGKIICIFVPVHKWRKSIRKYFN